MAGTAGGFGGDGGPADQARLSSPEGVAVDGAGNLYIGDTGNHRVRRVDTAGTITTVAGTGSAGFGGDGGAAAAGQLNGPGQLHSDISGNLLVADQQNYRIRLVAADLLAVTMTDSPDPVLGRGAAHLHRCRPWVLGCDRGEPHRHLAP